MMRSDTTPRGCGPRWPQRQQCHREGVCAVMQHPGAFQALAEQQPHLPHQNSSSCHLLHTRAGAKAFSCQERHIPQAARWGYQLISADVNPLQGHSLRRLPGVGFFRGLLLPAPEKHHENNSQHKRLTPARNNGWHSYPYCSQNDRSRVFPSQDLT